MSKYYAPHEMVSCVVVHTALLLVVHSTKFCRSNPSASSTANSKLYVHT